MSCRRTDDKVECAFLEPGDFDVYFIPENGTHRKVLSCMWIDMLYDCFAALGFHSTDGSGKIPVLTVPDTFEENGNFICQTAHFPATDLCAWYRREKSLTTYTSKSEMDTYRTPAGSDHNGKDFILPGIVVALCVLIMVSGIFRVVTKRRYRERKFPWDWLEERKPPKRKTKKVKKNITERDQEMGMLETRHKADMPFKELRPNTSTYKDEAEKITQMK